MDLSAFKALMLKDGTFHTPESANRYAILFYVVLSDESILLIYINKMIMLWTLVRWMQLAGSMYRAKGMLGEKKLSLYGYLFACVDYVITMFY